ncbi:kinesin-like protein KIN-6 isoform X2 [Populus alba]|uniref:kinesin-like protein KIN-6 isoform X2 n=1 Tax=Populus alba TaxID=43335 RepID=UPI0015894EA0|nr:kinesin-like protein KIN-6 isoform X2 [Populus alba]
MEAKSPSECPNTVTVRRNPHRRARPTPAASTNPNPNAQNPNMKREISSFPIQDILAMEIPQKNPPEPPAPATSENLKVYLRIRPIVTLKPNTKDQKIFRQRQKNAWPQNPSSKNNSANVKKNTTTTTTTSSNEVCIDVNDSHSVILSPPASLQDSKRIKSEVYEGFSHVFASDSTQNEVFEKMVKPLVDDFLNGKSGLLAALGPSGSGKTHTVFGTPREPGMVHLALEQIFKEAQQCGSKLTREFKVSVFEIYSDRGKGEKISDLSPDGGDLSMQQATIKGLQEVAISSAAQAESLIACAMLKRTTAMTNMNSQSSRSQCIINIHSFVRDPDAEPNNAVLTIVDLAGAEREKRTGNQGSRLIESNFINNTSMVFGLCLRSLLEHQSNPKKPLKMHFKNSMLTRYLRDYLEGKRRMTLILTVKPGEHDYSDTSYLLRQASPFMKIKFTNVEEPSMFLNKRHIEMLPRVEQAKKMKCSGRYAKTEEGKSVRDEHQLLPKVTKRIYTSDSVSAAPVKLDSVDLPRERNHQVMQNFAKALWNVLKQYKEKLMVAEREIESLNEVIGNEKTRYLKLEKELKDFKSCCSYSLENSTVSTLINIDTKSKALAPECNTTQKFDGTPRHDQNIISEIEESVHFLNLKAIECDGSPRKDREATPKKYDSTPIQDQNVIYEIEEKDHFINLKASECDGSPRKDQGATKKCDYTPRHDQPIFSQIEEKDHFLNLKAPECDGSARKDQGVIIEEKDHFLNLKAPECDGSARKLQGATKKYNYTPRHYQHVFSQIEEKDHFLNLKASECNGSPRKDQGATKKYDDIPRHDQHIFSQTEEHVHSLNLRASECDDSPRKYQDVVTKKSLDPSVSPKDVASTQKCNLDVPESELLSDSSCKPLNVLKPKRRLLPASSTLLRDIPLGIEDESENPKGNRGAKKSAAEETKRTQGSISLLRLLQSNLHV